MRHSLLANWDRAVSLSHHTAHWVYFKISRYPKSRNSCVCVRACVCVDTCRYVMCVPVLKLCYLSHFIILIQNTLRFTGTGNTSNYTPVCYASSPTFPLLSSHFFPSFSRPHFKYLGADNWKAWTHQLWTFSRVSALNTNALQCRLTALCTLINNIALFIEHTFCSKSRHIQ
jgi:hypothetical protein